ncbi:MAG: SpoIIE family protein phosphatase [Clostridia bacterium]|nr:SpoIIE family protein phosphatase [Clostridia bacterium]
MEQIAQRPEIKSEQTGREKGRIVWQAVRRCLPFTVSFFLLSLIQCFSLPAPFSVCCLTALLSVGFRPSGALLGIGLGVLFRGLWGRGWDVGQLIGCAACFPLARAAGRKGWKIALFSFGLNLARLLPGMLRAGESQTVILSLISATLGVAVLPALRSAARTLKEKRALKEQDDRLCLLMPLLLMISGAGRIALVKVNAGYFCASALTLTASWLLGGPSGAAFGISLGAALLIGGQSALGLVNLAFGGLAAGLLQGKKRALTAGVFLLCTLVSTYLTASSFQAPFFFAEGAAALLFCLLPGRLLESLRRFVREKGMPCSCASASTQLAMRRWARIIDRIADALPQPRADVMPPQAEAEALREALCEGCDRLPICWHEKRAETAAGMEALLKREEDANAYAELMNRYFSLCPRIDRLPDLLARMDEERVKSLQRSLCAEYERDMLRTHLTALSQAAQRILLEEREADGEESLLERKAQEAVDQMRFPGRVLFVQRVKERLSLCVQCDPLAVQPVSAEALAACVGSALGAGFLIAEQKEGRILLEQEPPLRLQIGTASACASGYERKRRSGGAPENGDAVLTCPLDGGKTLLALSDGMGHGKGAQAESRKTLELLSLCLKAGYSRTQAMTAVNGAMLSAAGGESFATVDLCVIDLWTGEAAMNKLGACVSFLFQGQKIRTVEGAALPLGIIEHVIPMEHRFTLGEGDMLLMLSDGITDAFEGEEEIIAVLTQYRDQPPEMIAQALLNEAAACRGSLPSDDRTALCARVLGRERRRR